MKPTNVWQVSLAASAIFLLAAAFGSWPYGFYQLLRWTILLTSAYTAHHFWTGGKHIPASLFIFCIILFNPIAPIHFDKGTWKIIDLIVGINFGVWYFKAKKLPIQ